MDKKIGYDDYKNENSYVSIYPLEADCSGNYYPTIKAKVRNKTNEIIKVTFAETYFIGYDKTQHDIKFSGNYGLTIEILPNVNKNISYDFRVSSDKNYVFNKNDLIISSFYINDEKYVLGFKIGNVNIKTKLFKNQAKKNSSTKGCVIAFIVFILFILMFF